MTTYFNFAPSQVAPFQFQPVLDGNSYNAVVPWSLFGQRYYLSLTDLSGDVVLYKPLAGSAVGITIEALDWSQGAVTLVTAAPHGYAIGTTISLTVSGCAPAAYNGTYSCLVVAPDAVIYALSANPGQPSTFGALSYDISLTAGYFASTLVYRQANRQFEVNP